MAGDQTIIVPYLILIKLTTERPLANTRYRTIPHLLFTLIPRSTMYVIVEVKIAVPSEKN